MKRRIGNGQEGLARRNAALRRNGTRPKVGWVYKIAVDSGTAVVVVVASRPKYSKYLCYAFAADKEECIEDVRKRLRAEYAVYAGMVTVADTVQARWTEWFQLEDFAESDWPIPNLVSTNLTQDRWFIAKYTRDLKKVGEIGPLDEPPPGYPNVTSGFIAFATHVERALAPTRRRC